MGIEVDEIGQGREPGPASGRPGWWRAALVAGLGLALLATSVVVLTRGNGSRPVATTSRSGPGPPAWHARIVSVTAVPTGMLDGMTLTPSAVWVTDWDRGTLTSVDRRSGQVNARIRIGRPQHGPVSLTYGGGQLWVLDSATDSVLRLDPVSARVTGHLRLTGLGEPLHVGFGDGFLWLTSAGEWYTGGIERLSKIDPVRLRLLSTVRLPGGAPDAVLAVGPTGVWVGAGGEEGIRLLDVATLRVVETVLVANGGYAPVILAGARSVWVATPYDLDLVDPAHGVITRTVPMYAYTSPGPGELARDGQGRLWLAAGDLEVLDPNGRTMHPVAGTDGVVLVATDGSTVWALGNGRLLRVDATGLPAPRPGTT